MARNSRDGELDERQYIRHKLYSGSKSSFRRYAELTVGEASFWKVVKYELITTFLGPLPGALGLFLRKVFYPRLFKHAGRGALFGRNITVRNAHNISLGQRVFIDDNCLIDGRGAGEEGIKIGDQVMINRNASIQAKVGSISIGANSDIGADCAIISQGEIYIGEMVTLGAGCHIGGGSFRLDVLSSEKADGSDAWVGGQHRFTRGPIRIGSRCAFAGKVTVTDGAQVGSGCVIAPDVLIQDDVPADSVVIFHQKLVVMPRSQFGRAATNAAEPTASSKTSGDRVTQEKVLEVIYRALDEVNEQLPPERRLNKSPETPLAEPEGVLDSLGLVNLIVTTERIIGEEFGRAIDLANPRGMLDGERPLATVKALTEYLSRRLALESEV